MRGLGLLPVLRHAPLHAVSALVLLIAGPAAAQDKPDFSGSWLLASPTGSAPGAAQSVTVRQTLTRRSVRGLPIDVDPPPPLITIAIERETNGVIHSESYTVGTLAGTVRGVPGRPQEETRSSVAWEGNRLVIEITYSGRPMVPGAYERKEIWSLNGDGTLALSVTEHPPGTEPSTMNLVYRKRP
jgi:hypothetical protein